MIARPVSQKSFRLKPLWLLGALGTGCGLIGVGFWYFSGVGPSERDAAKLYAKIQDLGVPLDTDAFEKSLEVPPGQNSAPELAPALAALIAKRDSRPLEVKKQNLEISSWADGPVVPAATRSKFFSEFADVLARISAATDKPRFSIERDWTNPAFVATPELAHFRAVAIIFATRAWTQAEAGNREAAVESLNVAYRLSALSGDSPTGLIAGLVSLAIYTITVEATTHCIQLDPTGAESYLNSISSLTTRPLGRYMQSEAFLFVAGVRDVVWADQARAVIQGNQNPEKLIPKTRTRSGLPRDPLTRSQVGYGLRRWLPLLQTLRVDGTPKNEEQFSLALERFSKDVGADSWLVGALFEFATPSFESAVRAWRVAEVRKDMALAYGQIVNFRQTNGRWPKSLDEAGVASLDRMRSSLGPFGYRVESGGIRIWSVGRDGRDDGGVSRKERVRQNRRDLGYDEVFIFQEKLAPAKW